MRAGRGACFHLWTNLTNIKPILGLAILILPLLILYKIQCTHKMNSVAWPLKHAEKSVKLKVKVKVYVRLKYHVPFFLGHTNSNYFL